jgi:hypothetical protein
LVNFSAALNGVVWVRMLAPFSMKIRSSQCSGVADGGDVLVRS